jgi:hypothetical protein
MGVLHIYSSGRFSGRWKARKRFFLKKEAKTFARLSRTARRQPCKSFLVLFSKKNAFLTSPAATTH